MSKYTTEVRYLCETLAGLTESKGYNDTKSIISEARTHIFDFEYPIYDNAYKSVLETKILRHYYTREICEETYGLWKLRLEDRMNIIMPYYNQLYKSALLEFNPFYDVDLTTQHHGTGTGIQENNTNTNGTSEVDGKTNETENINENGVLSGDKNVNTNENITKENEHTGNVNDENVRNENGVNVTNRSSNTVDDESGNANTEYVGSNTNIENEDGYDKRTEGKSRTEDITDTMWNLFSDTPQGGIRGIEGVPIGDGEFQYLTTATKNTDTKHDHEIGSTSNEGINQRNVINEGNENNTNSQTFENKSTSENVQDENNVSNISAQENNTREYNENTSDSTNANSVGNEQYNEIKNNDLGRETNAENNVNNKYNENTNSSLSSITTDEYLQRVSGKSGGNSYSTLLAEYRETFINIDEMIIEELSDLFFGLW